MSKEPFFWSPCWKCGTKLSEEEDESIQYCPKCKMPQFTKEGDEITDQEMYDELKENALV